MTPGESTDSARVAALLLPALIDEYGEDERTWTAQRSLHRVAAVLVEAGVGFVAQAKAEALRDVADSCIDIAFEQNEDVRDWLLAYAAAEDAR